MDASFTLFDQRLLVSDEELLTLRNLVLCRLEQYDRLVSGLSVRVFKSNAFQRYLDELDPQASCKHTRKADAYNTAITALDVIQHLAHLMANGR